MIYKYENGTQSRVDPDKIPLFLKAMDVQFQAALREFIEVLAVHRALLEDIEASSDHFEALKLIKRAEGVCLPLSERANANLEQGFMLYKGFLKEQGISGISIESNDGIYDPEVVRERVTELQEVIAHIHHECTSAYISKRYVYSYA